MHFCPERLVSSGSVTFVSSMCVLVFVLSGSIGTASSVLTTAVSGEEGSGSSFWLWEGGFCVFWPG